MSDFERALDTCADALREGRWTLEECLAQYPRQAAELRPQLLAVMAVQATYAGAPVRPAFAERARERFLIASGKRLEEAYDIEPSPSFFAAARVRFLMAAHRMKREGQLQAKPVRRWPQLMPGARALTGMAAALLLFFSFSTYTVASANNSLPGDWQYPVKLETERVRVALAFNEGDKRSIRLDIANERANEIDELTKNGDTIGSEELNRLADQTASLVRDAKGGSWDTKELAKLQDVSEKSSIVLQQAAPQVEAAAAPALAQAVSASQDALRTATVAIAKQPQSGVLNPTVRRTATPPATSTPPASSTPGADATSTPEASPTPLPPTPETAPPTVQPKPDPSHIIISGTPIGADVGVLWNRLAVGNISALIPSEKDGWHIAGSDFSAPSPSLVHLSNVDGTSLIVLNVRNGDMWWLQLVEGSFQEADMRVAQSDGSVLLIDPDVLHGIYGTLADIPLYVLNSITVELPATPVPPAASPPTRAP